MGVVGSCTGVAGVGGVGGVGGVSAIGNGVGVGGV